MVLVRKGISSLLVHSTWKILTFENNEMFTKIYQLTRKEREMSEGFFIQIILERQVVLISIQQHTIICSYSAPKFSTSFLMLMLLVASLGILEIWYNNDDDVIMIVITTSASYTMEGRILWMPFNTLTESGLEMMMFCLTSGHSSFSRDKKSGFSRLMINIVILKGHHNRIDCTLWDPDLPHLTRWCCNVA